MSPFIIVNSVTVIEVTCPHLTSVSKEGNHKHQTKTNNAIHPIIGQSFCI